MGSGFDKVDRSVLKDLSRQNICPRRNAPLISSLRSNNCLAAVCTGGGSIPVGFLLWGGKHGIQLGS